MEFPAFRSERWMQEVAFAPLTGSLNSALPFNKRGATGVKATENTSDPTALSSHSSTSVKNLTAANSDKQEAPLYPPSFCFAELDLLPPYLASFPSAGLYLDRVRQVQRSIKRALFRQSIFRIQNVEVLELRRCPSVRRLVSSDVVYDLEQRKRQGQHMGSCSVMGEVPLAISTSTSASGENGTVVSSRRSLSSVDDSPHCAVSNKEASGAAAPHSGKAQEPKQQMPCMLGSFCKWFSRGKTQERELNEHRLLLREEIWSVDRCNSVRKYRVQVFQGTTEPRGHAGISAKQKQLQSFPRGDFYSVSVCPLAVSDKIREKLYYWRDSLISGMESRNS